MKFQLYCVVLFVVHLPKVLAMNIFGINIDLNCMDERSISGCPKESLVEACERMGIVGSDETEKKPETDVLLFTRHNKNNPEFLNKCGGRLPGNSCFNPKRKTIVLVHGFLASPCLMPVIREIKDQLLFKADYNVVLLDWSWGSFWDYADSVMNSKIVAKQLTFVLKNIMEQAGIGPEKFYLIGQSLGAQVVGQTAEHFKDTKFPKFPRITALDPALPAFHYDSPEGRIDRSDAEWLDVIHTGGGPCLPYFGDNRPLGHADFYVNGGSIQLSCITDVFTSLLKGDIYYGVALMFPTICSHLQSYGYFKASINACTCEFIGVESSSWDEFQSENPKNCEEDGSKCAVMGFGWDRYPRQKGNHTYYLKIDLFCPYCNNDGIELQGFKKYIEKPRCKPTCFSPDTDI